MTILKLFLFSGAILVQLKSAVVVLALEPDSPTWFTWLATQSAFRFVGQHGRFTAHHEVERVPNGAWRAHRQIRHHSYNLRLGLTQELTITVLEQAADTLQAHLN